MKKISILTAAAIAIFGVFVVMHVATAKDECACSGKNVVITEGVEETEAAVAQFLEAGFDKIDIELISERPPRYQICASHIPGVP